MIQSSQPLQITPSIFTVPLIIFLSFQNEGGFIFNIVLTTYMPSEPLVLKGFWAKNQALIVSFKKIRERMIPNFEKQIRYDWQLLRSLN